MMCAQHASGLLVITPNEPEGWAKAFEVSRDGYHVAWFRFRDTADQYVLDNPNATADLSRPAIAKAKGGAK